MKRHLLYHITPIGSWLDNIELLNQYIDSINGTISVALALDDVSKTNSESYEELVRSKIKKEVTNLFVVKNDVQLRESATLKTLFSAALSIWDGFSGGDIFAYAHTKGVTHSNNKAVEMWTDACYLHTFGNVKSVEKFFLDGYWAVGPFKRYGKFPHFPPGSDYHYSGTFYWFNPANFFEDHRWKSAIKAHKYGAEAYPSLVIPSHYAACNFADGVTNLYDLAYCKQVVMTGDVTPRAVKPVAQSRKRA